MAENRVRRPAPAVSEACADRVRQLLRLEERRQKRPRGRQAHVQDPARTQSAEFTLNSRFKLEHEPGCKWAFLTLPKVGRVKLRWTRDLPTVPKTVTVIRRPCGRYEASFTTITTSRITPKALHAEAGVDIGLLSLGVVRRSDGTCEAIENPRFLKNSERRLRHLDRELARKRKGSRNYEKACTRRARACQKVKDTRLDYLTKTARSSSTKTKR